MPKDSPRGANSEETRKKKSESAKRRWDTMKPEVEIRLRKAKSSGMRRHWKKFTKEERKAIGRRISITKAVNRLRKLEMSEEEIENYIKEKYGVDES